MTGAHALMLTGENGLHAAAPAHTATHQTPAQSSAR